MHSLQGTQAKANELADRKLNPGWQGEDNTPVVPCARVFLLLFGLVLASWIAVLA